MKRLKERVWWCFDWRKKPMMLFSALSVFKVLHIWPFTVWTLHASKQRKWLPKWLKLLWALVLQPGVSSHYADSWAGRTTYHLQMYIQKMLKAWLHTLGRWWLISTSFLIRHLFRVLFWARLAHIMSAVDLDVQISERTNENKLNINHHITERNQPAFATRQIWEAKYFLKGQN